MLVDSLGSRVWYLYLHGDISEAVGIAERAVIISRRIGSLWGLAYSLMPLGMLYMERGEPGRSLKTLQEARQRGAESNYAAGIIAIVGGGPLLDAMIYCEYGAISQGLEIVERELQQTEIYGPWWSMPWILRAQLLFESGELEQASTLFNTPPEDNRSNKDIDDLPLMYAYMCQFGRAEIAQAQGDYQAVLELVDPLIDGLHQFKIGLFSADLLLLKSKALLGLHRFEEARAGLNRAREIAEANTWRRTLWRIYDVLSQLEVQHGDKREAAKLHGLALEVVRYIADHAGSDELRDAFLSKADVRRILQASLT